VRNVLDASALLTVLFDEPGAEVAAEAIAEGASISAVNWSEAATVLVRQRRDPGPALARVRRQVDVVPLTDRLALAVATLYPRTRAAGLSLGDRACLALAGDLQVPAFTADREWADLDVDVEVRLIR
jgi:ribonuclease VapC